MSEAAAREIAQCYEDLREKDEQIERLKSLVTRAADALNNDHWCASRELYGADAVGTCERCILIDELRKAAAGE